MILDQPIITRTVSGKRININNIQPGDIVIDDIAHALARQCRFGGHVDGVEIYSVAEHLVLCSDIMKRLFYHPGFDIELDISAPTTLTFYQAALSALLHDAAECYLTDVITPIKKCLQEYIMMEEYVQRQVEQIIVDITDNNLLISSMPEKNRGMWIVDKLALCIEAKFLTNDASDEIETTYLPQFPSYVQNLYTQYIYTSGTIKGLLPSEGKRQFLKAYNYYKQQISMIKT